MSAASTSEEETDDEDQVAEDFAMLTADALARQSGGAARRPSMGGFGGIGVRRPSQRSNASCGSRAAEILGLGERRGSLSLQMDRRPSVSFAERRPSNALNSLEAAPARCTPSSWLEGEARVGWVDAGLARGRRHRLSGFGMA